MKSLLVASAFASLVFFPLCVSLILAFSAALASPVAPLALGIFADILYRAPYASTIPVYTIYGAALALLSYGVRRFIETSIIRG